MPSTDDLLLAFEIYLSLGFAGAVGEIAQGVGSADRREGGG